jgi:hypothetical protein
VIIEQCVVQLPTVCIVFTVFLLLRFSFNACWSHRMHGIISIFLDLLRVLLCLKIWPILEKFHGLLRRRYALQKLDEIFCRYWLGPFDLWFDLDLEFLNWFFVWMNYLLVMEGIKDSHYHCVGVYIYF